MAQWANLLDDEWKLLRKTAGDNGPENVLYRGLIAKMLRFQVAWLKKLGKTSQANAAVQRLVEVTSLNHDADPEMLQEVLVWLVDQKEWAAIDDLVKRFGNSFPEEPGLLYTLAEAYAEQGRKAEAQKTADKAFNLKPGKEDEDLLHHLRMGQQLGNRGRLDWARCEYESVIARSGADDSAFAVYARTLMAEMLHEHGQDLEAANVLEKVVQGIDLGRITEAELQGRDLKEVRGQWQYFLACRWKAAGDAAKQREFLQKALQTNPADVDVLIACYRLPNQSPQGRAKVVAAIKKLAAQLREQIAEEPDTASTYNQLAWLIGNTEGDFDQAIKMSLTSLDLKPDDAGYYDTLAHVYAAKGDLKNAIKYETKAAKLEPHTEAIRVQLEEFRKKLNEK